MSRSFIRTLAVGALLAVAPAIVEAQGCVVVGPATTCNISRNATFTIPTLAYISLPAGDITLSTPTFDSLFVMSVTPVQVETATPMTLRANTTHTVTITSGAIVGGTRTLADHGFKYEVGGCTAGGFTALSGAAQPLITGAPATNGVGGNLCLESTFDPTDLAGSLAAGAYTIPLTLTITAP